VAAGCEVAGIGVKSFIEPRIVLYTPQPRGTPTKSQANSIAAAEDFFAVSAIVRSFTQIRRQSAFAAFQ
jgi:hypothetical protein